MYCIIPPNSHGLREVPTSGWLLSSSPPLHVGGGANQRGTYQQRRNNRGLRIAPPPSLGLPQVRLSKTTTVLFLHT